jgi:hypothetical protein
MNATAIVSVVVHGGAYWYIIVTAIASDIIVIPNPA